MLMCWILGASQYHDLLVCGTAVLLYTVEKSKNVTYLLPRACILCWFLVVFVPAARQLFWLATFDVLPYLYESSDSSLC